MRRPGPGSVRARTGLRWLLAAALATLPVRAAVLDEVETLLADRLSHDPAEAVRSAAARMLAPLGHAEARQALETQLAAEPAGLYLYEDALAGLPACSDPAAAALVVAKVSGAGSPRNRALAAEAAFPVAPEAAMVEAAKVLDDPSLVREAALARAIAAPLAQLGGTAAQDLLARAFRRYGGDEAAGPALVVALAALDPTAAAAELHAALGSSQWTLRRGAVRELPRLGAASAVPLLEAAATGDPWTEVREQAYLSLLGLAPDRVGAAAAAVFESGVGDAMHRAFLADRLADLAWSPAEASLLEAYRTGHPAVRAAAARALGAIGSPLAIADLLAALADRDQPDTGWIRTWSARALAGMPTLPVARELDLSLRTDREPYVMSAAAESLGAHGTDEARGMLVLAAAPKWPVVCRRAAVKALGRDALGLDELLRVATEDPADEVRAEAVRQLGVHSEAAERRVPALRAAAREASGEVRAEALRSLSTRVEWARHGEPEALSALAGGEPGERLAAVAVLRRGARPGVIPALSAAAVADGAREVRGSAQDALLALDPGESLRVSRLALSADPDPTQRLLAARRIGRLDPGAGFPELRSAALRDPEARVRRAAVEATGTLLGRMLPAAGR